jgi:uncharacterized protein (TIGR03067 family)
MKAAIFGCFVFVGFLFVPGQVGWGQVPSAVPRKSTKPSNETRKAEEEALEGDWLGVSYDFDGRAGILLKDLEYVTLSYRRSNFIQYCISSIDAVGDRSRENTGESGGGTCYLDMTRQPHIAVLDPTQALIANPEVPPALKKLMKATKPALRGGSTTSIAYSLEGDMLTIRLLSPRASRQGSLSARKHQPNLVFHLKRVENAFRAKPGPHRNGERQERGIWGTWIGVSYQNDGKAMREFQDDKGARMVLTPQGYVLDLRLDEMTQFSRFQGKCEIDAAKTPHELRTVPEQGTPELVALFELNGDELKWCQLPNGDNGPAKLETKSGDERVLIIFRRQAKP